MSKRKLCIQIHSNFSQGYLVEYPWTKTHWNPRKVPRSINFKDNFYNVGHGAYFADDPKKSHGYTGPDSDGTRVMYYSKVLLGNESKQATTNSNLVAAPLNFHSVVGTLNGFTEYIVYRYGQALPYMKILYKSWLQYSTVDKAFFLITMIFS